MFEIYLMDAAPAQAQGGGLLGFLPLIIAFAVMIFFTNRSRKKQEQEAKEVRDSMEVGDEIVSIGGIVGRVVKLEDNTILMESGSDRTKLRFTKSAIANNISAQERIDASRAEAREAQAAAKAAKKEKK